jgi:hypothetical protein
MMRLLLTSKSYFVAGTDEGWVVEVRVARMFPRPASWAAVRFGSCCWTTLCSGITVSFSHFFTSPRTLER